MANGLEPVTSSLVDSSRVSRVYNMLVEKNENVRTGDNTMLNYARGINTEALRDATVSPTIIIKSLSVDSNIVYANYSLDESLQMLTSKVLDFTSIVDVNDWNETKTDLYCGDCSFSIAQIQ